jgi:phage antirepressor YoqD-like protein
MANEIVHPSTLTMTSREVSKLTGKRHAHVLRDIDSLLETLNPDLGLGFTSSTYVDSSGKVNRQVVMDRDSVYCLMTGYDSTARMRVIKRLAELEEAVIKKPGFGLPDFTNPAIAARAWADQVEKVLCLESKLEAAQFSVDYHRRLSGSKGSMPTDQAAKVLGIGEKRLRAKYAEWGLLRRNGAPYQKHIDAGRFEYVAVPVLIGGWEMGRQILVTAKGLEYLFGLMQKDEQAAMDFAEAARETFALT